MSLPIPKQLTFLLDNFFCPLTSALPFDINCYTKSDGDKKACGIIQTRLASDDDGFIRREDCHEIVEDAF
jgi:hypothetical protein